MMNLFVFFIWEERRKVAFLAVMESTVSLAALQTVVFDSVVTNVGNGYNAGDGIFAADYSGLYQFSASIMAGQGGEVWTYISLNEKRVAMIYDRASDQRHDQGANTVILQLQKGDRVSVVNRYTAVVYGGGYSSFSGALLVGIIPNNVKCRSKDFEFHIK